MARPARSSKDEKPTVNDRQIWETNRELWDRASRLSIQLEQDGKPHDIETLWNKLKRWAPSEYNLSDKAPVQFVTALESEGYKQLLDIRKRMTVIPALANLGVLKELASQASYMALVSALDTLITTPEKVPMHERRLLAKTFMDMNLKLSGIKVDEEEESKDGEESLGDIAAAEQAERERVLQGIPEEYRELMGQKWDEERVKALRTRQAIHTTTVNRKMGHAKD